jgi:(p)ppGpp synthase/HD superfamily hydrolase
MASKLKTAKETVKAGKDVLERTLRRLGKKKVEKMDKEATSSMYDDVSELSAAEKRALQKALDAEKKGGTDLEKVEKKYTPAQRKKLEDEMDRISRSALGMAKGGKVPAKKMMAGGMTKKYAVGGMANCGASVKASGGSRNK